MVVDYSEKKYTFKLTSNVCRNYVRKPLGSHFKTDETGG